MPHTAYMCNVPISHGEITIVTSDSALDTMRHSARMAIGLCEMGLSTMLINCGMSKKRFNQHFYETHDGVPIGKGKGTLFPHTSVAGNLADEQDGITQIVSGSNVSVVIITGWEFTSSNYRRRQKLLFYLRTLMEEQEVAIVIYAHCANQPVAGKIDKGGIGKLAMISSHIAKLELTEEFEDRIKKPQGRVVMSDDWLEAGRSAQLLISKINRLGTHPEDTASTSLRDLSSEGEGSELVLA